MCLPWRWPPICIRIARGATKAHPFWPTVGRTYLNRPTTVADVATS